MAIERAPRRRLRSRVRQTTNLEGLFAAIGTDRVESPAGPADPLEPRTPETLPIPRVGNHVASPAQDAQEAGEMPEAALTTLEPAPPAADPDPLPADVEAAPEEAAAELIEERPVPSPQEPPVHPPADEEPAVPEPGGPASDDHEPGDHEPGDHEPSDLAPDANGPADPDAENAPERPDDGSGMGALGLLTRPELPKGFLTDDELDRQEREAAELHEQAVALRSLLDAPPQAMPVEQSRRSRGRGVLVLLALLVLALVAALVVAVQSRDRRDDVATTSPSTNVASPSAGAPASTNPGANPVQTLTPELQALAGLGLPITGVGIDTAGTAVSVHLIDNTVRVDERILLAAPASGTVTLGLPPTTMLTGEPAKLHPSVDGLTVSAGGRPLQVSRRGNDWTVHLRTGQQVTALLAHYRLGDAILISEPSTEGRAFGLVLPLVTASRAPVVAVIHGGKVLGISCPGAIGALTLCGRSAGDASTAAMPAGIASQALLLQLDVTQ